MKLFQKSLVSPSGRAILLSVKPIYSELILSGAKRIEFRRSWAAEGVGVIAIYASAPTQRIVALVDVEDVVVGTAEKLWGHCKTHGGGVSKQELDEYFKGKKRGYGIFLGQVHRLRMPMKLEEVFPGFSPPQSFRYLTEGNIKKLVKHVPIRGRKA